MHQRTLRDSIEVTGIGLHTGKQSTVRITPAAAQSGITFLRGDLSGSPVIPAHVEFVTSAKRCTVLGKGPAHISTVEHILSALWSEGIDNARIEVKGPEIPNLDGSALPWVKKIRKAGVVKLSRPRQIFKVQKPIEVRVGDSIIAVYPYPGFRVFCTLSYHQSAIGTLPLFYESRNGNYVEAIAPARTFGFLSEVSKLRRRGLARGGNFQNALVVGNRGYVNKPRFTDEPVRHKVLDLLGDLALLGFRLEGCVIAVKSGHRLHHRLVERLYKLERK